MEKCESVFFCGELTRHPDKKMKLQEQKNKIKALETSATKLEQELRSREAAFDRVHGSVNKLLEDMLLEEYPEEYVQNNSRNWLKIQQDIAFVKKSLKGSGPPRREIVKSLIERKKSVENDKRLGLPTLPERDAAANSSTTETCSQTRVRLATVQLSLIGETLLAQPLSACRQTHQRKRKRKSSFTWLNSCLLVPYLLVPVMEITQNKQRKRPIFCCPSSLQRNE